MVKMLPIPNEHRWFRINLINNLDLLVNEIEAAQERIGREIINGNSIEEVGDARNGEPSLGDRLRKDFAEKISKGEVSVDDINKNLGKLNETHLTEKLLKQIAGEANIHATPANDSLTTEKYADKSIIGRKTDFIKTSSNLFNVKAEHTDKNVSGSTGELVDNASYNTSDFIHIKPSRDFSFHGFRDVAYYDADREFIERRTLSYDGETQE